MLKEEGSESAVEREYLTQQTVPSSAARHTLSGLSWISEAEWALLTHETCVCMKVPSQDFEGWEDIIIS